MTDIRQCWAHHPDGHRCQAKATHRGDHYLKITWTDQQATGHTPATPVTQIAAMPIPLPAPVEHDESKCVACKHRHRAGDCKCGCREFIG